MLSSECSFIGYTYQEEFHRAPMPRLAVHLEAKFKGHNMLTLNPQWSVAEIVTFIAEDAASLNGN